MNRRLVWLALVLFACSGNGEAGCDPTLTCSYDPSDPAPPTPRLADVCERGCSPTFLSGGAEHTCASLRSSENVCWGRDEMGSLGAPTESYDDARAGFPYGDQVMAGAFFGCAKVLDRVACFGRGYPVDAALLASGGHFIDGLRGVASVAVGGRHVCAIDATSRVWCSGASSHGQAGAIADRVDTAVAIAGLPTPVHSLALGGLHTCAIAGETRDVYCWGDGRFGATGSRETHEEATPVEGLTDVIALSAGAHHTCAIAGMDRELWCFGRGLSGETGSGRRAIDEVPVRVATDVALVATGGTPFRVENDEVVEIAEGVPGHTFYAVELPPEGGLDAGVDEELARIIEAEGDAGPGGARGAGFELFGFGSNADGQLGLDDRSDVLVPTAFRRVLGFVSITAGGRHSCLSSQLTGLECFGDDSSGQLGHEAPDDVRAFASSMRLWAGIWPRRRRGFRDGMAP